MDKLEKIILNNKRWERLNGYIEIINENKEKNPNIALDSSKSIIEKVSKTILKDKGQDFKKDDSIGKLVKKTFSSLPVFIELSERDSECGKKIVNALSTIASGIGEFRNSHSFLAHGQDMESKGFNNYLIELVIQSSDLLSSFLIISHNEDLKNRKRMYYDEYPGFNKWFDKTEEWVVVKGIELSPSKSLFYNDKEFYKQELFDFENSSKVQVSRLDGEDYKDKIDALLNISKFPKLVWSNSQIESIKKAIDNQETLTSQIKQSLQPVIDSLEIPMKQMQEDLNKADLIMKPIFEKINPIEDKKE